MRYLIAALSVLFLAPAAWGHGNENGLDDIWRGMAAYKPTDKFGAWNGVEALKWHSKVAANVGEAQETYPFRKPGDTFKDCDDCPAMVVIPQGRFRMGDHDGIGSYYERPAHDVNIGYSFAVGRYEVTWLEWEACERSGGCGDTSGPANGGPEGWGRGRRPVIHVDWDDAKAFVAWLSTKTGLKSRVKSGK